MSLKQSFFFFFFLVFQRVQGMWSAREDSLGLYCQSYEEYRLAMVIANRSNTEEICKGWRANYR